MNSIYRMSNRKRKATDIKSEQMCEQEIVAQNGSKTKQMKLTEYPGTTVKKIETKTGEKSQDKPKVFLNKIDTDYNSINFDCNRY